MSFTRLFVWVTVLGMSGLACSSSAGSNKQTGSGGEAQSGAGGAPARGGATGTGGTLSSGGTTGTGGTTATGGSTATGGTINTGGNLGAGGGGSAGTRAAAGSGGSAGSTATGAAGSGGGGATGVGGNSEAGKPAPVLSAGCGTQGMQALISGGQSVAGISTSHRVTIQSSGQQREYIIDIPSNYDATHPYRLFFAFHWYGSSDTAVANGQVTNGGAANWGYYGLKREATMANEPAIFVAPEGTNGGWGLGQQDHAFFDDMYNLFLSKLCIDTGRVFATGFSFGAMMTYSLSLDHQKQLRAVVGIAAANWNIYDPPDTGEPIAYMGTVGMNDTSCPYVHSDANKQGGKYCALTHAMDNGCTIPATIPTTTSGSKTHVCYDFQGCKAGYPVKMCTFDGIHQAAPLDGASGDNGLTSWIPPTSWQFFTQF